MVEEYLKDYNNSKSKKDLLAVERLIEQIVEISIKINKKLLKKINIIPVNYKDSFLKLKKLDIFSELELEELSNTAIFRNELSHEYRELDKIYTIENIENIKKIIKIYPKYLRKIIIYLEKNKN